LVGGRACYLTETKPLANQLHRDFAELMTDIRGRGNYDCIRLNEEGVHGAAGRCDRAEGLCAHCPLQEKGCHYFDRWRAALKAELVLTNYSYWLAINEHNEQGIGKYDLLIADEAHGSAGQLSAFLKIEISAAEVGKLLRRELPKPKELSAAKWKEWGAAYAPGVRARADRLKLQANMGAELSTEQQREMRECAQLAGKLEKLSVIDDRWIEGRDYRKPADSVHFEPIWPAPYAETLFQGIKKVVLLSATLVPKDLEKLGIAQSECEWLEFPSSFPVASRPIAYVPTVQMKASMSEAQKLESVRRIDQIIRARQDRKGIVHTVSYDRGKHLFEHSQFRELMLANESRNTQTTMDRYLSSPPPKVLVGPSYDTGYDFPGEAAEYQIIMKVPFVDTRSEIEAARVKDDPDYSAFCAMKSIVQMAGRIVRSAEDRGETLITDDQWAWFRWKFAKFAPRYFLEACVMGKSIPQPLRKL